MIIGYRHPGPDLHDPVARQRPRLRLPSDHPHVQGQQRTKRSLVASYDSVLGSHSTTFQPQRQI